MANEFGYNLGALCLPLQQKRYDYGMDKIEGHLQQIEKWTEDQKHINHFLSAVLNAKQGGATVIDFHDEEHRVLVDRIREIDPHLISSGVYTWDLDHLPMLTENLQARVSTIETSIGLRMMYVNHDMQELTELIREFQDMIKQDRDSKLSMIRNAIPR